MKHVLGRVLLLIMLTWIGSANAAEMWAFAGPGKCADPEVRIQGSIVSGDAEKLEKGIPAAIEEKMPKDCKNRTVRHVWLDSRGGNIDAAMALGRVIRQHEMYTGVSGNASCQSSCVFLLAAGVSRIVFGEVGIHRPYFEALPANKTIEQVRKYRESMNARISQYFEEMDISPRLLDSMLGVPPEDMRILSEAELKDFRLEGTDANWDERVTAVIAETYGMSSAEYRQRSAREIDARVKYCAGGIKCPQEVTEAAFWGISVAQAKERRARVRSVCLGLKGAEGRACRNRVFTTGN